jgi:hypothetical protein
VLDLSTPAKIRTIIASSGYAEFAEENEKIPRKSLFAAQIIVFQR